jgi:hypothetical protein
VSSRIVPSKVNTETSAPSAPEVILTGEEVAARLKLNPQTIYELTRRRNKRPLPSMRAGMAAT